MDLKDGDRRRLLPGGGLGTVLGRAVTAVEQRELWVAVLIVNGPSAPATERRKASVNGASPVDGRASQVALRAGAVIVSPS